MPTLFIRVLSVAQPQSEGYQIGGEWLILENDGAERGRGVTDYRGFAELVDPSAQWLSNPSNVVLIVPSEHVLGVNCEVPGRNVNQIRKALPFVVEEFVATDIEGMHLAHGGIQRNSPVHCNLIDRVLLAGWQDCFASLGIPPGFVVSEAELLPDELDTAFALFDGDHVLIKTGGQAATLDRGNLSFALGGVEESRLRVVNGTLTDAEHEQFHDRLEVFSDTAHARADTTLGYLAHRWRDNPDAINLLQGEFRPPSSSGADNARWRSVGLLAACWVGLALFAAIAQGWWADHQANKLETQALALYKDIYPGDKRVSTANVRRRTATHLGEGGGDANAAPFLSLLGVVASTLDPNAFLQRITYNGNRSELGIDLVVTSYDELDRVKEALTSEGLNVEMGGAEQQQDNKVRTTLRLTAGGGAP